MTNGAVLPRADATAPTGPSPDPSAVADIVAAAIALARRRGREDLVTRLSAVAERVARTDTVVCVVGEFKKGKSALINALLGAPVCPVDDDLATMAVTVVRYAPEPGAIVRRREGGELIVEAIPAGEAGRWVAESDGDDRRYGVEVVEVGLPDPFLERGIALVDTPGVGGLNAAHAAATLAFLPSADALVFVTDASTELSAPELAFLASAMRAGPPILIAVTKVDIYPEWRRIVAIDEGRLTAMGLADPPFPLSSVLRTLGLTTGDPSLEGESGYPRFATALAEDVVGRARAASLASALAQVLPALDQLRESPAAEAAVLDDPAAGARLTTDLREVRGRLATLAAADASWSVRLEDEFASLRTRSGFAFQARMRALQRELQDEIEKIDPARAWPEVSQRIQADTAAAVRAAFLEATDGAAAIQGTIAGLLADETPGLDGVGAPVSFDVATLWQGGPTFDGRARSGLAASLGLFGGASWPIGGSRRGPSSGRSSKRSGSRPTVASPRSSTTSSARCVPDSPTGSTSSGGRSPRPPRRSNERSRRRTRRDGPGARSWPPSWPRSTPSGPARWTPRCSPAEPFRMPGEGRFGVESGSCRLLQSRPWHRLRRG